MIFVTVGNHPQGFDRLLKRVDELAKDGVITDLFIQIGYSNYKPKYCPFTQFIGFNDFQDLIEKSHIVITHGGEGSISNSLLHNKPTIVVPRLKRFREHTNDHQIQITRALEKEEKIIAVYDIEDLQDAIRRSKTFRPKKSKEDSKIVELIEDYLIETDLISVKSGPELITKAHWDSYHEQWKDRNDIPANPRTINAILSVLDIKGKKILEVGSGSGRDSIYLAKLGADCYLVDYVETPLKIARHIAQKEKVKITTIKGDVRSLPFEADYFDLIYSQGLLEHFTDPEVLLKEQTRVLKKGGYILVDVPQKYHLYTLIKHFLMKINKWVPGWETEYSISQLERLIKNCGLTLSYTYGDWSHPMLLIKMAMIAMKIPVKKRKINLHKDNKGILYKIKRTRFAHYTFQHIGVIGKKTRGV